MRVRFTQEIYIQIENIFFWFKSRVLGGYSISFAMGAQLVLRISKKCITRTKRKKACFNLPYVPFVHKFLGTFTVALSEYKTHSYIVTLTWERVNMENPTQELLEIKFFKPEKSDLSYYQQNNLYTYVDIMFSFYLFQ